MSEDGEYEVRNKYGDLVQKGELEVRDINELPQGKLVEFELHDAARVKRGDTLSYTINPDVF